MSTEKVNKELECPICMDIFKLPKLLSCMHTYCEECLKGLMKEDGDVKKILCPICRHETKVSTGINCLHTNFIAQNVAEALEAGKLRANGKLKCSECEEDFACDFCNDCKLKLCLVCSSYHKRGVRYKGHKIINIANVPQEKLIAPVVKYCMKHNEMLKYYCEKCKLVVCHDCTISKSHNGHSFNLVNEVVDERREDLRQIISDGKQTQEQYETYIQKVDRFLEDGFKEKEKSVKVITDTFEKLVVVLNKKKGELIEEVNESYQKTLNLVQNDKEESKTFENILQFTVSVVENGCNTEFIEIYSDIKDQLVASMARVNVGHRLHPDPHEMFELVSDTLQNASEPNYGETVPMSNSEETSFPTFMPLTQTSFWSNTGKDASMPSVEKAVSMPKFVPAVSPSSSAQATPIISHASVSPKPNAGHIIPVRKFKQPVSQSLFTPSVQIQYGQAVSKPSNGQAVPLSRFGQAVPQFSFIQTDPISSAQSAFKLSLGEAVPVSSFGKAISQPSIGKAVGISHAQAVSKPKYNISQPLLSGKQNSTNATKTQSAQTERGNSKQQNRQKGDEEKRLSLQKILVKSENVPYAITSLTNICSVDSKSDIHNKCNNLFVCKEIFFEG